MDLEQYIHERKIEGTLLASLQKLSDSEKAPIETLLEALSPSANTLRDLLTLAQEIAARDKTSVGAVLSAPEVTSGLTREGRSRKDKQKDIRSWLECERYPHKRQLQVQLANLVKQVHAQTGLRLELPEEFEGDTVCFSVAAKSTADLETVGEKLKIAASSPATAEIFAILRGDY